MCATVLLSTSRLPLNNIVYEVEQKLICGIIKELQLLIINLYKNMLSKTPMDFKNINIKDADKEILRLGIISELDAINLYEQLSATTKNKNLKVILLDIAKEEKTHMGEFQALLLKLDKEQVKELEAGKKEVEKK
jgi:rubrerythrin